MDETKLIEVTKKTNKKGKTYYNVYFGGSVFVCEDEKEVYHQTQQALLWMLNHVNQK